MNITEQEQKFTHIYESYVDHVSKYLLRRTTRENAADVLADTFMVAWRKIDDVPYEPETRFWLYSVARKSLANNLRGGKRRSNLNDKLKNHFVNYPVSGEFEVYDSASPVNVALDSLDAGDKEILLLSAMEGLKSTEIALVLGITHAACRTRKHRAQERFRAKLGEVG